MVTRFSRVFSLVFVLALALGTHIRAEEIRWPYFQYPPLYTIDQEGNVSGYGVHVQKIISRHMPGYTHKMVLAQPARIFADYKNGERYLAYGPVKTPERETYMVFSLPCRLVFTDGVIMDANRAQQYLQGAKISLEKLLSDPQMIMGHSKDASYGQEIDGILKKYEGRFQQEVVTGEESEFRQIKMIQSGRIDWMIWDPLGVVPLLNKADPDHKLGIYEIAEKKNTLVFAHITAPKNEWGIQMIRRINRILKQVVGTDEFYRGLSRWVPDDLQAAYRQGYEELIIKPALAYQPTEP
ncbi:MAG: hypothetical protein D3926_18175 [Desulfobacteraceae bacterium]|nr:MAG: hypothetical protein D3926_18175 [Desulfobacteraceae bacterium]